MCYNPSRPIIKYIGKKKVRFIDMFNAIKETEEYKIRKSLSNLYKYVIRFSKVRWEWYKNETDTTVKEMYDRLIKKNEKVKELKFLGQQYSTGTIARIIEGFKLLEHEIVEENPVI